MRVVLATRLANRLGGRLGFLGLALAYAILVIACLGSLAGEGELTLGRNPLPNPVSYTHLLKERLVATGRYSRDSCGGVSQFCLSDDEKALPLANRC